MRAITLRNGMATNPKIDRTNRPTKAQPTFEVHCGDALQVLRTFPKHCVDMCVTSPPYWGHREYDAGGIGEEPTFEAYIENLIAIIGEVRRVLKPEGSLWLNLGDTYRSKSLSGIPWRVALKLIDEHNWTLRNDVIWNKMKGAPDNSKDKLRNTHESFSSP